MTIKNSDIAKHLNLPPVKLHCSMLAEDAIKVRVGGRRNASSSSPLRVRSPQYFRICRQRSIILLFYVPTCLI